MEKLFPDPLPYGSRARLWRNLHDKDSVVWQIELRSKNPGSHPAPMSSHCVTSSRSLHPFELVCSYEK